MRKAIKLFSLLFVLNLILSSCTVQEEVDNPDDIVATDPPKKDLDPPIDPND